MKIYVFIAYTDNGDRLGCFRTFDGAVQCIKEELARDWDCFTTEEKARITADIEKYGCADGYFYIESAGELGD
jgi:hypothetical protein